jgi:hypothetical protein
MNMVSAHCNRVPIVRPVLGVYLAYYEKYAEAGAGMFKQFLMRLDRNAELIVVCNGDVFCQLRDFPAHVINGNNVLREFSGWESGLDFARAIGLDLDSHLLVFANDTFCHHNNFGPISQFAFRNAFRRLINRPESDGLVGEKWQFNGEYEVDGVKADRWVATYLFALSGSTLKKIGSMSPQLPMKRFYAGNSEQIQFSALLSQNLADHILAWLAGGSSASWKNHANANVSSIEYVKGKINSIICEKALSAKVASAGDELIDVFESRWLQEFRRVETLFNRIAKTVGLKRGLPPVFG